MKWLFFWGQWRIRFVAVDRSLLRSLQPAEKTSSAATIGHHVFSDYSSARCPWMGRPMFKHFTLECFFRERVRPRIWPWWPRRWIASVAKTRPQVPHPPPFHQSRVRLRYNQLILLLFFFLPSFFGSFLVE